MKKTTFILLILVVVTMSGCSKNSIRDSVDGFMQSTSGNKPPQFFMFADPQTADNFILQHKDFSVKAPSIYSKDWQKMTGWKGGFIYSGAFYALDQYSYDPNRRIVLGYTFEFTSYITKYAERERALEKGDNKYLKNTRVIKSQDGEITNLNLHLEYHGKENYPCKVGESTNTLRGMMDKFYVCYKFNPERTMAKNVVMRLIYTRVPNLPKELEPLAQEYTYEDLQNRANRVLDSLYIKDGWEK